MRIDLLKTGVDMLTTQSQNPINRINFVGFDLATSQGFTFDYLSVSAVGSILYSGGVADMRFYKMDDHSCTLKLIVPRTAARGVIGNILLKGYLNGVYSSFALIRQHDENTNIKLQAVDGSVGTELYVHVLMTIPDFFSRFDMSNLVQDTVEWLSVVDSASLPGAFDDLHDQAIIQNHAALNRSVHCFNVKNLWMGDYLGCQLYDTNYGIINGGVAGDGYRYTPNSPLA